MNLGKTIIIILAFVFFAQTNLDALKAQEAPIELASVGLDDFVIKPGQAAPVDRFSPTLPQSKQQSPYDQPNYEPSVRPISQPTQQPPILPPNGGSPQVMEIGLTGPSTVGNSQVGGGPEWQILQNPNGPHTAILFDPIRQVIAVYQIDSASGAITLKSVRNVSWDLRIEDYNSNKPAPKDIRAMQP